MLDQQLPIQTLNFADTTSMWNFTTNATITAIDMSADGNYIVIGCATPDPNIYLFETSNSTPLWNFSTGSEVNSVAISQNGSYFIAGTVSHIFFFHKSNSTPLWNYTPGGDYYWGTSPIVDICDDGFYAVTTDYQGEIMLFNRTSPDPMLRYHEGGMTPIGFWYGVAISGDGTQFVGGGQKSFTQGYDVLLNRSTEEWQVYRVDNGVPLYFDMSTDGQYFVSAATHFSSIGSLRLYNKTSSSPEWEFPLHIYGDYAFDLSASDDCSYIALIHDYNISLFHRTNSSPLWNHTFGDRILDGNSVDISSDGSYILCSNSGGIYSLIHRDNSTPFWELNVTGGLSTNRLVRISGDGTYFGVTNDTQLMVFSNEDKLPPTIGPPIEGVIKLNQPVVVDFGISDYFGIDNIIFSWSNNSGLNWYNNTIDGGGNTVWTGNATIPGHVEGTKILYHISANDTSNHWGYNNNSGLYFSFNFSDLVAPNITGVIGGANLPDSPILITTNVTDLNNVTEVILSYTNNSGVDWHNITMSGVGTSTWSGNGSIPGQPDGTIITYQLFARDQSNNWAFNNNSGIGYTYIIDVTAPVIQTPSTGATTPDLPVILHLGLTDLISVDKVIVSWSNDSGITWHNITATGTGTSSWNGTAVIPAHPEGTTILYQIYANDTMGHWENDDNGGSFFSFTFEYPPPPFPFEIIIIILIAAVGAASAYIVYVKRQPKIRRPDAIGKFRVIPEGVKSRLTILMESKDNYDIILEPPTVVRKPISQRLNVSDSVFKTIEKEISYLTHELNNMRKMGPKQEVEVKLKKYSVKELLKEIGTQIYSNFIPESINDKIKDYNVKTMEVGIDDDLLSYPWELTFDGENYLGIKYSIGRYVVAERQLQQAIPYDRGIRNGAKFLIIGDPTSDKKGWKLPEAEKEAQFINDELSKIKGVTTKLLLGKEATIENVTRELQADYDFIHYSGHAAFDVEDPDNSAIYLNDGKLMAKKIRKLLGTTPPIMAFINACESSMMGDATEIEFEAKISGLAASFLLNGINYVGSMWPIRDDVALSTALNFYFEVLSGTPIGEALRRAKQFIYEQFEGREMGWASYVLYGDPTLTLEHQ